MSSLSEALLPLFPSIYRKPTAMSDQTPTPSAVNASVDYETSTPFKPHTPMKQGGTSQYNTVCISHQKASLECIERYYGDPNKQRSECVGLFDAYKRCRREEHAEILRLRNPDNKMF
jgi:hypothetical protein